MYEQYFGLRERPFNLTPNPRFLFMSARHREALAHLRYGLGGRAGITVLTGEAGTGKTTLIRTALSSADLSQSTVVHLSNPTLTREEFFEYVAAGFGFPSDAGTSKTRFLQRLETALTEQTKGLLGLVVDEAQSLSYELLEELRLLTNVYSKAERAVTLLLVGQPELAERLREVSLRQLRQRVSLRCELRPFDLKETAAYVTSRVRIAGGNADAMFTREAIVTIYERSGGIPRTISVICDNALVTGFAADVKPVGRDLVLEVCRDFELTEPEVSAGVPANSTAQPGEARGQAQGQVGGASTRPNGSPRAERDTATAPRNGTRGADRPAPDPRPLFSGFSRRRRFLFF